MIPRTFPSVYVSSNGDTAMVVYKIVDTAGLTRWVDYIPVRYSTDETEKVNSYDNNATLLVSELLSTAGKQAGLDYIRVYEDVTATVRWTDNANGYIPILKYNDYLQSNLQMENNYNLLQEIGDLIKLEA